MVNGMKSGCCQRLVAIYIGRWNGVGLLSALGCEEPSIGLRSDASGQCRCGAAWQRDWLQL